MPSSPSQQNAVQTADTVEHQHPNVTDSSSGTAISKPDPPSHLIFRRREANTVQRIIYLAKTTDAPAEEHGEVTYEEMATALKDMSQILSAAGIVS